MSKKPRSTQKPATTSSEPIVINVRAGHMLMVRVSKEKFKVLTLFLLYIGVFGFLILNYQRSVGPHYWQGLAGIICGLGSLAIFKKPSETWEYTAWQSHAQKREKSTYN